MNDPGLDEPIADDAKDVEKQRTDEKEEREEDEQAFLEPRYVIFLFGLSVCGLGAKYQSSRWRMSITSELLAHCCLLLWKIESF